MVVFPSREYALINKGYIYFRGNFSHFTSQIERSYFPNMGALHIIKATVSVVMTWLTLIYHVGTGLLCCGAVGLLSVAMKI